MAYRVDSCTDGRNSGRVFTVLPAVGDFVELNFNFSIQITDRVHRSDGTIVVGNANYILILSSLTP